MAHSHQTQSTLQVPASQSHQQITPTAPLPQHLMQRQSSTQLIAPLIEPNQYLAAIPVQPVIATTAFPGPTTVISPVVQPSEYGQSVGHSSVVLTPAQNQVQDHLQRKHEELQQMIVQQQEELRRVSEQLFIARYGLLPSIVNVSMPLPFASVEASNVSDSRCISNTSTIANYRLVYQLVSSLHSSNRYHL